ncbi:MAG: trk system potassium uptake protein TrkH [Paracoccaceae bacterium]|jgi:trk system potassium uptake protein TrkH
MMRHLLNLPLILILMAVASVLMFVPVIYAVSTRDWLPARAFTYSGILFSLGTLLLCVATYGRATRSYARSHLTTLVASYAALPVMLAVPFYEAIGNTTFLNAYVEMVSSFTTTGATLFTPDRLSPTLHLWRAMVGWVGGYFVWVTAIAILAPMNLGGFEVTSSTGSGSGAGMQDARQLGARDVGDPRQRLARYAGRFAPVYAGLTVVLWGALVIAGEVPFVAICHAMSTLATSGISPVGGTVNAQAGLAGEVLIFLFFAFAITRQTFAVDFTPDGVRRLRSDPEARMGLACVLIIPALLFLRHWIGAYEVQEISDFQAGFQALWGSMFAVLSFLTTTGFESAYWQSSRAWSGLETPGLILMGLALIGGGVATTAGGVKLMRVHALYTHGRREMERLIHPHSVGGSGVAARRIRRQGAFVAWIFFMLFALSIAAVSMLLALAGLDLDASIVLAVAATSTTGPIVNVALTEPIALSLLPDFAKAVFAGAMVLGRLETLAFIALLNPEFWRG